MRDEEEVGMFLGKMSLNDGRKVDKAVIAFWHEAMRRVTLDEALAALLEHQTTSTEWVTPAHLLRILARHWENRKREQRIAEQNQRALQGYPELPPVPKCATHPTENIASCRFCWPRKVVYGVKHG